MSLAPAAAQANSAQPVVVDEVSGDADAEAVVNTLLEDQLVGRPGADVAHDRGEGNCPSPVALTCFFESRTDSDQCFPLFHVQYH